jgi:anti-sigma factor RsiW
MTCTRWEPLISAFVDGELDAEASWQLKAHVAECEHCAAELETLRRLKWSLAAIETVEPDDISFERVKSRVMAEVAPPIRRKEQWGIAGGVAAASVLAILLAVQVSAPPKATVVSDRFDASFDMGYAGSASTVSTYAPVTPSSYRPGP